MPQGIVIAVQPGGGLTVKPCHGTIKALDDDPKMGIVKGNEYAFKEGKGKCCTVNNVVTIKKKNKDGSVDLDCD